MSTRGPYSAEWDEVTELWWVEDRKGNPKMSFKMRWKAEQVAGFINVMDAIPDVQKSTTESP